MDIINAINDFLWSYLLIWMLLGWAVYFTIKTGGVQFVMIPEMLRLLVNSSQKHDDTRQEDVPARHKVSSFQAFAVSIASRVGTGNMAGVATAIVLGGPGAVFWMWVIALLGSANAFIESTLAQLFKVKGENSFRGGPAYYISRGIGSRAWAVTFAVLISVTFGWAYNSVQANTITASLEGFGVPPLAVGIVLSILTLVIICGGIRRISRFSEIVVPVMAILYILLAIVVIGMNITRLPEVLGLIFSSAFDWHAGVGGAVGAAVMMGIKRGLFSNEAGQGSAPNVAATASVSHPVKQGLIQTLGVFTDTLIICSCTAFIILFSGVFDNGETGIKLTQTALDSELGAGSEFVAVAIFFFAFTSIVGNYYYAETNLQFITSRRWVVPAFRLTVAAMVFAGSVATLDFVWAFADITMGLMTACNLGAIALLGRYAIVLLRDYRSQRLKGYDPTYHSSTLPSLDTPCWK
ncbi:MAG: alanine:cation symporter family protein [Muribaculaceae bacterium]|nr:alanine:cation symporter family protein [Muribaculaceae bacterium]